MSKVYKFLDSLSSLLYIGQKVILATLATIIVIVNVSNVFARYVIHSGISWSQEISIAIFMTMIFLGANIAMKTDSEVRIDLIKLKNARAQLILSTIIDIICLGILLFLFLSSIMSVINTFEKPQMLSTVKISYSVLYMVMPIGFFLMIIDKAAFILRRFYDSSKVAAMQQEEEELSNTDK